ncbi:polysaccharide pyruvyl transferase family protein [Zhihengliuella halotolerans]|uniref:polysaccharide pyruvyl transferase family protein n=1 Tax=Zhihengliuella halotolerans TaxID=370736 RepID=UPI0015E062D2|nr:polysaccharide pyruvyl transferase family protein [Zhihengliuella halotolerans]
MRVLVLHGYSAKNLGDGLLVEETLSLVREALGDSTEVTLVASHPTTFAAVDAKVLSSALGRTGYSPAYLKTLFRTRNYDLIVAVGGGYLRFGRPLEAIKTLLIHVPQLVAAALSRCPSIYLSQSVGPLRFGTRRIVARLLRKIDVVALRDDRSISEASCGAHRIQDLALISGEEIAPSLGEVAEKTVLSVRAVHGVVPQHVLGLAERLGEFDAYIQSLTGGNDDREATEALGDRHVLTREELMSGQPARVVIAVRLHAALMALRAGHYVIHLAYERKGFGAFQDLGLDAYVHNVNDFDIELVLQQARDLRANEAVRDEYVQSIEASATRRRGGKSFLIGQMRELTGSRIDA